MTFQIHSEIDATQLFIIGRLTKFAMWSLIDVDSENFFDEQVMQRYGNVSLLNVSGSVSCWVQYFCIYWIQWF